MKLRGVQLPGPLLTIVVVMTMSLSAIAQQRVFNQYLEYQFLVSGKGMLRLEYHSEKATDKTKEIEL